MTGGSNALEGRVHCVDFFASLLGGLVEAQTPEDIAVDGSYSDWSADSLMASNSDGARPSVDLERDHALHRLGRNRLEINAVDGADLFVYLNTSEGGSVLARDWGFAHTLPFAADHGFVLEDDTYHQHVAFDGSAWVDQSTPVELYAGWADNKATELALPWSALGSPSSSRSWCTLSGRMQETFGLRSRRKTPPATTVRRRSRTHGTPRTSPT